MHAANASTFLAISSRLPHVSSFSHSRGSPNASRPEPIESNQLAWQAYLDKPVGDGSFIFGGPRGLRASITTVRVL